MGLPETIKSDIDWALKDLESIKVKSQVLLTPIQREKFIKSYIQVICRLNELKEMEV